MRCKCCKTKLQPHFCIAACIILHSGRRLWVLRSSIKAHKNCSPWRPVELVPNILWSLHERALGIFKRKAMNLSLLHRVSLQGSVSWIPAGLLVAAGGCWLHRAWGTRLLTASWSVLLLLVLQGLNLVGATRLQSPKSWLAVLARNPTSGRIWAALRDWFLLRVKRSLWHSGLL